METFKHKRSTFHDSFPAIIPISSVRTHFHFVCDWNAGPSWKTWTPAQSDIFFTQTNNVWLICQWDGDSGFMEFVISFIILTNRFPIVSAFQSYNAFRDVNNFKFKMLFKSCTIKVVFTNIYSQKQVEQNTWLPHGG